jgi:hypothetical protein
MSYETAAYDKPTEEGFGPDPVVVLVATGTHDVSRLINLLHRGQPVVEQSVLAKRVREQVARHNGGRAALQLLHQHGGPDLLELAVGPPVPVSVLTAAAAVLAAWDAPDAAWETLADPLAVLRAAVELS